jgi:hypothetical protein
MSAPRTPQDPLHPEAALLPWFAAGTLSEPERQDVARHLADCVTCRAELDEIQRLRSAMKGAYAEAPQPSPAVWQRVRAQIDQGAKVRVPTGYQDSWWGCWWARPWVPAFATALIVGQFVTMGWMMSLVPSKGSETVGPQPGEVTTRNIPPAAYRVKVSFLEGATEQGIRALLKEVHGRIVDGPLPGDVYLIEVPTAVGLTIDQTIEKLQARADLVKSAERPSP